jgi:hypothetical protein
MGMSLNDLLEMLERFKEDLWYGLDCNIANIDIEDSTAIRDKFNEIIDAIESAKTNK